MKKKDILFIIISGFLLVVAWIGFSIFHNIKTSTIPEATNIQIAPIAPVFDMKTIEDIKKRKQTQAVFEKKTTLTPTATNSASLTNQLINAAEENQEAIPSGIQQQ